MNNLKTFEIFGNEADELITNIKDIQAKLNDCLKSAEEGELDEVQVNFLKSIELW